MRRDRRRATRQLRQKSQRLAANVVRLVGFCCPDSNFLQHGRDASINDRYIRQPIPSSQNMIRSPDSMDTTEFAQIIANVKKEQPSASNELINRVYKELRKRAAARMRNETPGQTFQPTE